MDRAAAIEALEEIENGMCRVKDSGDIWQDKLVYALCQAARLLLTDAVKRERMRYDWEFAADKSEVGRNCKRLQKEARLSTVELAERAGIARNGVQLLESGRVNPGVESVLLICQALGCTPNELLAASEEGKG